MKLKYHIKELFQTSEFTDIEIAALKGRMIMGLQIHPNTFSRKINTKIEDTDPRSLFKTYELETIATLINIARASKHLDGISVDDLVREEQPVK